MKLICWFAVTFVWVGTGLCRETYDYIDITNPFLRKIPVAVPLFKALSADAEEIRVSTEASDLLSGALDFTGYFEILKRELFLFDPQTSGIVAPDINFQNWTTVGAELLVTGGVLVNDKLVEMELRLYDTVEGRLLVGKRYKGWQTDQRRMIHKFCSEVMNVITGNRGIFESKIAFVSTGTGNKEIYSCDFDGHNPKRLTRTKTITLSPAWSSDGKWIAYTSYVNRKPDLYIRNLREKRGAVVARKGINIAPAWVPGKFELAATLSFSGDPEIYRLTGAGKIIKRLTYSRGIDVSPAWSPDGKKMAFVSKRAGTPQIYIMDLNTSKLQRLTFQGRNNTTPSWSPTGDKIAYTAIEDGETNIYVIGVDGSNLLQLTRNAGDNEAPTWSPDGSLIAFGSTREGPSRIYVMTAYGTDQRRLIKLKGAQTSPNWSANIIDD
jgi:TolB protein